MNPSDLRILYVAPNLPNPATSGGAQRTGLLLQALSELGHVDVVFLPARLPDDLSITEIKGCFNVLAIEYTNVIREHAMPPKYGRLLGPGATSFYVAGRHRWQPFHELVRIIGDIQRYDFVVSRYLSSACILDLFRHAKLIIDVDDYDPDRLRQRLRASGWLKRLTLRRCLHFSLQAHHSFLPRAAHCWVSNPADRRHDGLSDATLLPNIPYLPAGFPEPSYASSAPPVLLFVGTLSYSANSDGLDAFLRQAWLAILHSRPSARLRVVGQGMSEKQRTQWGSLRGVEPIGFVENLAEMYSSCRACIAPMLAGAGTNIKVLEAAAYNRACVVTPVSHRGFEDSLPADVACLRAESVADMAQHCLLLLGDPNLATRIGANAREVVRQHYTQSRFTAAVRAGCDRVLGSGQG